MTAPALSLLACASLATLTSLRAEIHTDDPVMVAALEEYAKFAAKPSETVKKPSKTSEPVVREKAKSQQAPSPVK